MRKRAIPAVVLLVCAAGIAFSGCGGTVVDSQKAEDAIQANIEDQSNLKVTSVSCPDDVDVKAGNTFTCDIEIVGGQTASAELKILNDDADVKIVKLNKT